MDLGEDLISFVCLVLNAIALVRCGKLENLDAMNGGWLGVFRACLVSYLRRHNLPNLRRSN
jgi:hypothetical protein